MPRQGAIRKPLNDLVQIHILFKCLQLRLHRVSRLHLHGRAQVQFTDANTRRHQRANGFVRFLVFHGQMAGIVVHPQMFAKARIIRVLPLHLLEKRHRLRAGLNPAQRLGLQPQVQGFTHRIAQGGYVLHAFP